MCRPRGGVEGIGERNQHVRHEPNTHRLHLGRRQHRVTASPDAAIRHDRFRNPERWKMPGNMEHDRGVFLPPYLLTRWLGQPSCGHRRRGYGQGGAPLGSAMSWQTSD